MKAVKKVQNRRATRNGNPKLYARHELVVEPTPLRKHKSRGKKGRLSLYEKIYIVHKILCGHHTHDEIAREMRVT